MYKLTSNPDVVLKDGVFIPKDKDNKDWKKYLKWLEKGNIPEAADTPLDIVQPISLFISDVEKVTTLKNLKEAILKLYKGEY